MIQVKLKKSRERERERDTEGGKERVEGRGRTGARLLGGRERRMWEIGTKKRKGGNETGEG